MLPAIFTAAARANLFPLSKERVLTFLHGDVSPHRVAEIARERGIDFRLTTEIEKELRDAGATDELITILGQVAPSQR